MLSLGIWSLYILYTMFYLKLNNCIVLREKKPDYANTHTNLVAPLAFTIIHTNHFADIKTSCI